MPVKSEAQRRLMEAAAHAEGGYGGVSQSVAKEFLAHDASGLAAGIMFQEPSGKMLLVKRGDGGDHPGEWAFPGGIVEDEETPEWAAMRECVEEIGGLPIGERSMFDRAMNDNGVMFVTYKQPVREEFTPRLNDELSDHVWASPEAMPEPLHPGVSRLMGAMGKGPEGGNDAAIAMDESIRSYDRDGRMRVEKVRFTKAAVNEYLGKEIPHWQKLGLDPYRRYKLLRDPEELEKAAESFNGVQLLIQHKQVNANDHRPGDIVGTMGTETAWESPYLTNSLIVWDRRGVEAVESEEQKELSSSYHYDPDMTPGVWQGQEYDGVMRNIVGNHVALVQDGRAGDDVVVGDSSEELNMTKTVLTRKAAAVHGALMFVLAPKLAQDAKIDFTPALADVNAKNFKAKKPEIFKRLQGLTTGKLAQDATMDDVVGMLDRMDTVEPTEGADIDPNSGLPSPMIEKKAGDAGGNEKLAAVLKAAGVSDEVIAAACAAAGGGAMDAEETPEEKATREKKEKEDKAAKDAEMADMVKKPAMDAAIAKAVTETETRVLNTQRAIQVAAKDVAPYLGENTIAMDAKSPEDVYKGALEALGVDLTDAHPSGFKAMLKSQPLPNARKGENPRTAMDAKTTKSFADRFPNAARIQA